MAMIWYPGQDVDFTGRLSRIEDQMRNLTKKMDHLKVYINETDMTTGPIFSQPGSLRDLVVETLEKENSDLRMRIDDLEENVLCLIQEIDDIRGDSSILEGTM